MFPIPLTLDNLTLPKEKTYYTLLLIVSILAWLVIAITIIGLLYAALAALAIWLANGWLVAHLKANAVKISAEQMPEFYQTYVSVCDQLEVVKRPELYVIQSDGLLNAFATRHSGRDFVVIYSSILEAYGHNSPQIKFLFGHEIGHIKSQHIFKRMLLLPGLLIPLLSSAYLRACEATCDRFGAFGAKDIDGAVKAMVTLGGGKEAAQLVDPVVYAEQHFTHRGFFVSWHELASGYPTLSQRVSNLLAIKNNQFRRSPSRHPLAYLFAFFNFKVLIVIYLLVILAGIALPAINEALKKAQPGQDQEESSSSSLEDLEGAKTETAEIFSTPAEPTVSERTIPAAPEPRESTPAPAQESPVPAPAPTPVEPIQ
jgi:Zn-dependent protease with chaperone function